MKIELGFVLGVILFFGITHAGAQSFPEAWEGKWVGEVEIWNHNEQTDAFPMSLEISPNDTIWNYILSYNRDPDQPDVRKYSLVPVDPSIGHYAIDEHNSIILDSYVYDNCLFTSFGGLGSELVTRICQRDDTLEFEIISGKSDPVRISGDTVIEADTVPPITSYSVYNRMVAVLKKEN